MPKSIAIFISLLALAVIATLVSPVALAQSAQFKICGEVLINGTPVNSGTYIEARIAGEKVANTKTAGSNYCIII